MRILLLSHQYPPESGWGGIGSYVVTLSRALVKRGHEVHVLTCWHHQESLDRSEDGVTVHRRRSIRIRGAERMLSAPGMRALTRRLRPPPQHASANPSWRIATALTCLREFRRLDLDFDVIESPDWMAEGLLLALRGSVPVVVDFKGNLLTYTHGAGERLIWQARISSALEHATVWGSTVLTSPSQMTIDFLQRSGWRTATRAQVIRRPVDPERWPVTPAASTPPMILLNGRLETIKAPDVLIRAAGRLAKRIPDLEVVFIGSVSGHVHGSPALPVLQRLAEQFEVRCRFKDHVPWHEIGDWYARARVVALPSRFDNFPNVGLEAMACGRPVVSSSRTGLAELADDSGGGIAVVPPEDPDALAEALEPFLVDPALAERAGEQARRYVERECSPMRIAAQRESVYREAMAQAGRVGS